MEELKRHIISVTDHPVEPLDPKIIGVFDRSVTGMCLEIFSNSEVLTLHKAF